MKKCIFVIFITINIKWFKIFMRYFHDKFSEDTIPYLFIILQKILTINLLFIIKYNFYDKILI